MAASKVPERASTPGTVLVDAFAECWASMTELGRAMSEDDWNHPSLCPDWRCKDALLHVTTAEIGFSEWEDLEKPPVDKIRAAHRDLRERPGAEVLDAFARMGDVRLAQLRAMSDEELDRPSWTAAGPGSYRRYMEIRVFDHWAHEQDVRVPLGRPGHMSGLGADLSLNEAHIALGYLVGKRAGLADGSSVTIHVTGPTARDLHAVVEGRAKVVEDVADPAAEVTTDFATFMLLCCGRIDPEGPLADGRVTLGGDEELAGRVARNLAFTI
jgi:uncharacterized protein (TIGR03083 family)